MLQNSQNAETLQHHSPSLTQISLTPCLGKKSQAPSPEITFIPGGIWTVFLGISSRLFTALSVAGKILAWCACCSWQREQANHNILLTALKPVPCPIFIHSTDVATGSWAEVGLPSAFHPFRTSHSKINATKTLLCYSSFNHVSIEV